MDKFDFNIELDNHLKYYISLVDDINKTGEDIENLVKLIIDKKEKEDTLSKDDFIKMDLLSMRLNLVQLDIVKVVARITLLYQMSFGFGIEISLSERNNKILMSIINNQDQAFIFEEVMGNLMFKDSEIEKGIQDGCTRRIDDSTVEERYKIIKDQYDDFVKKSSLYGNKKADTE